MVFQLLEMKLSMRDKEFDTIYPEEVKRLSKRHFTPLHIATKAARLLVHKPGMNILDIGSGVGKFCMIASCEMKASYYGN